MKLPSFTGIKDVKTFVDNAIIGYKTSGVGFQVFLDETNLANQKISKKIMQSIQIAWNSQRDDEEMKNIIEGLEHLIFDIWGVKKKDYEMITVSISAEQYELQYQHYGTTLVASHKGLIIEHTKDLNKGNSNYYLGMFLRLVLERMTEREKETVLTTG